MSAQAAGWLVAAAALLGLTMMFVTMVRVLDKQRAEYSRRDHEMAWLDVDAIIAYDQGRLTPASSGTIGLIKSMADKPHHAPQLLEQAISDACNSSGLDELEAATLAMSAAQLVVAYDARDRDEIWASVEALRREPWVREALELKDRFDDDNTLSHIQDAIVRLDAELRAEDAEQLVAATRVK
jgi:hypothetical protein